MGNTTRRTKKAKIMKTDGKIIKFKIPVKAYDVVKDHPGYVLLESNVVKRLGVRAKPLEPDQELEPCRIYFLVELPNFPDDGNKLPEPVNTRVPSGLDIKDRDRLEMLTKRSSDGPGELNALARIKVKLPKAQVEKLMIESKDEAEVAQRILDLYLMDSGQIPGRTSDDDCDDPRGQEPLNPVPAGSILETLNSEVGS